MKKRGRPTIKYPPHGRPPERLTINHLEFKLLAANDLRYKLAKINGKPRTGDHQHLDCSATDESVTMTLRLLSDRVVIRGVGHTWSDALRDIRRCMRKSQDFLLPSATEKQEQ